MKVGDTFFFGDTEYAVKNIELVLTRKFPTGRVDASKFVGSHDDGTRTIQRGRPKAFHYSEVADILGEATDTPSPADSDVESAPETVASWDALRDSSRDDVSETLSFTTDSDW